MSVPIIIFSIDEVRGKIIINSLRFQGYEALLFNRTNHTEAIISENLPSVVILDSKGLSPGELDYFKSAYTLLSNTPLIVLVNRPEIDSLELDEMRTELCKTDPLDAELIISKVKTLLEQKSNSAAVQKNNSAEVESHHLEKRKEEEPYKERSLEDDLKKFLDLE